MKQTESPAAMRERLEQARKWWQEQYRATYGAAADINPQFVDVPFWLDKYAQAAQPSSEKIEAVARRIADEAKSRVFPINEITVAAILREELGGGK